MAQKRKDWNGLISGFKASDLVFLDESGCNMDMTRRSPGCGSQRLLRCRLHPAGRGPNSSSLFPPLAAVVAVASGLTDGSRAVSTKKEDPLLELALQEGVFFLVSQMTSSISTFTIYSICHSPQKSSAVQKVYTLAHTPGTSSLRASSRRAVPSGRSLAASIWPGETW